MISNSHQLGPSNRTPSLATTVNSGCATPHGAGWDTSVVISFHSFTDCGIPCYTNGKGNTGGTVLLDTPAFLLFQNSKLVAFNCWYADMLICWYADMMCHVKLSMSCHSIRSMNKTAPRPSFPPPRSVRFGNLVRQHRRGAKLSGLRQDRCGLWPAFTTTDHEDLAQESSKAPSL